MIIKLSIVFFLWLSTSIVAMDPSMAMFGQDYNQLLRGMSNVSPERREKMLEEVQAFYIETLFVKPIFQGNEAFSEMLKDEDEDSLFTSSQDSQMTNMMLSRHYAKLLAKQDLLNFKQLLKTSY